MRGTAAVLSGALALTACDTAAITATADRTGRNAARSVTVRALIQRYPDVPHEPAADCIAANATAAEVRGLASDSLTGPTEATFQSIGAIIARPETQACLRDRTRAGTVS